MSIIENEDGIIIYMDSTGRLIAKKIRKLKFTWDITNHTETESRQPPPSVVEELKKLELASQKRASKKTQRKLKEGKCKRW